MTICALVILVEECSDVMEIKISHHSEVIVQLGMAIGKYTASNVVENAKSEGQLAKRQLLKGAWGLNI